MSLRTLWWRVKPPTSQETAALRSYAAAVLPHLLRITAFRDEWLDRRNLEEEEEQLANAASVHRWEITRLVDVVRGYTPPPRARALHQDALTGLRDASRAFQLLATGTRYHRSETLCDGQSLLLDAADRVHHVAAALDGLQSAASPTGDSGAASP